MHLDVNGEEPEEKVGDDGMNPDRAGEKAQPARRAKGTGEKADSTLVNAHHTEGIENGESSGQCRAARDNKGYARG